MDSEKLIEFVREYKFLYDVSDKRYSDNQKKDEAWKEISKQLKVNEKNCKKAWTLLRDSFRRALKKQKETRCGPANVISKKWKYEDEMAFLLPYLKERPGVCLTSTKDENLDEGDVSLDAEFSIPSVDHYPPDEVSTPLIERLKKVSHKKSIITESPSATLMKYILDNKKAPDDIEQFFAGIVTTVKTFPLRERAIAKAKVFEVISKMELDILSDPSVSYHSNNGHFSERQMPDTSEFCHDEQ